MVDPGLVQSVKGHGKDVTGVYRECDDIETRFQLHWMHDVVTDAPFRLDSLAAAVSRRKVGKP